MNIGGLPAQWTAPKDLAFGLPERDMPFEATPEVRDHRLFAELQRAARVVSKRFDDALRPLNLTSGQYLLLISLDYGQPARIGSVAELLGMDRSTLTAMLKPMKRRGLIDVTTHPGDRRSRLLSLTRHGKKLLAIAIPVWETTHTQLEQRLDNANIKQLRRAIEVLSRAP